MLQQLARGDTEGALKKDQVSKGAQLQPYIAIVMGVTSAVNLPEGQVRQLGGHFRQRTAQYDPGGAYHMNHITNGHGQIIRRLLHHSVAHRVHIFTARKQFFQGNLPCAACGSYFQQGVLGDHCLQASPAAAAAFSAAGLYQQMAYLTGTSMESQQRLSIQHQAAAYAQPEHTDKEVPEQQAFFRGSVPFQFPSEILLKYKNLRSLSKE